MPTSNIGAFGQKCLSSGIHCTYGDLSINNFLAILTFSETLTKLSIDSIERHNTKTSVSGYDSGPNRS